MPLFTSPLVSATIMTSKDIAKRSMININNKIKSKKVKKYLSNTNFQNIVTGGISGVFGALILTPSELIKCRIQTNSSSLNREINYFNDINLNESDKLTSNSSKLTVKKVILDEFKLNGLKGFFQGYKITVFRDLPGYAAMFLIYNNVKDLLINNTNFKIFGFNVSNNYLSLKLIISGGLAGSLSWIFCYPQDTIKTLIQTNNKSIDINTNNYKINKHIDTNTGFSNNINKNTSNLSSISGCCKSIYNKSGLLGFYKGLKVTTARSFITNAIWFSSYETAKVHITNIVK